MLTPPEGEGKSLSRSEPGLIGQEVSRSGNVMGTCYKNSQLGRYWERSTHTFPTLYCT